MRDVCWLVFSLYCHRNCFFLLRLLQYWFQYASFCSIALCIINANMSFCYLSWQWIIFVLLQCDIPCVSIVLFHLNLNAVHCCRLFCGCKITRNDLCWNLSWLTAMLCCFRFSPERIWYIDQMLKVLTEVLI